MSYSFSFPEKPEYSFSYPSYTPFSFSFPSHDPMGAGFEHSFSYPGKFHSFSLPSKFPDDVVVDGATDATSYDGTENSKGSNSIGSGEKDAIDPTLTGSPWHSQTNVEGQKSENDESSNGSSGRSSSGQSVQENAGTNDEDAFPVLAARSSRRSSRLSVGGLILLATGLAFAVGATAYMAYRKVQGSGFGISSVVLLDSGSSDASSSSMVMMQSDPSPAAEV